MMKGNEARDEKAGAGAPAPGLARRGHLAVAPNPSPGSDYVVTHLGRLGIAGQASEAALCLRYVPDRLILAGDAVEAYLAALGDQRWGSLEELAATAFDDLNNELVARWLHLSLSVERGAANHHQAHRVTLEDRQPGWDNPDLLARLAPC